MKRITLILLALGALAQGTAQSPPPAAPTPAEQAGTLLKEGKNEAALALLNPAVAARPGDLTLRFLTGQAHYQKNDYATAISVLSPLAKPVTPEPPHYRQTVQMLAMSHYLLGHLAESIPYLEQVARWFKDNTQLSYALGVCYIQTRQPDKSRALFAGLYQLDPKSAAAYLMNARMLLRQQFEETAETELAQALKLDSKIPQAHFLLGEIAVYRADLERGVSLFQQEIAVNPAFDQPYYRLGETYTRQLKWDEAISPLQKAIWLNPYFSGPYIVLGKVYLKKADLGNAENMLRRAVQMDPNNSSAHHLLAQTLQQAGRAEEAKQEFAIAEKLRSAAGNN
jgi:tetratricopeptide (TPR) repeat protein